MLRQNWIKREWKCGRLRWYGENQGNYIFIILIYFENFYFRLLFLYLAALPSPLCYLLSAYLLYSSLTDIWYHIIRSILNERRAIPQTINKVDLHEIDFIEIRVRKIIKFWYINIEIKRSKKIQTIFFFLFNISRWSTCGISFNFLLGLFKNTFFWVKPPWEVVESHLLGIIPSFLLYYLCYDSSKW